MEEGEITGLQLRINGFANTLIIAHLIDNRVNRVDTKSISLQLHHCELEIKRRRTNIVKSNKLIVELLHKRSHL